jgi:ribonuclease Z
LFVLGTASQIPTRRRNPCSMLFRWRDHGFLFDVGEGTQRQLFRLGLGAGDVDSVFISHFHGDHVLGLPGLVQSISLQTEGRSLRVVYPLAQEKYLHHLLRVSVFQQGVKVEESPIKMAGPQFRMGDIRVEAHRLNHKLPSWGYVLCEDDKVKYDDAKIEAMGLTNNPLLKKITLENSVEFNGKTVTYSMVGERRAGFRVGYLPDTRECPGAGKIARNCDVLICEATYLDEDRDKAEENGHLTARQAARIASVGNVKHLVITHFSQRYQDREEQFLREAQEIFPSTIMAEDLMTIYF